MEDQLKQYLSEFVQMLKDGGQFVIDEMPGFIHEYLAWSTTVHAVLTVASVVMLVISYVLFRTIQTEWVKEDPDNKFLQKNTRYNALDIYDWKPIGVLSAVISATFAVAGTTMFLVNLYGLLMIVIAPRYYLVKHLMELI